MVTKPDKSLNNLMPIQEVNARKTREERIESARNAGIHSGIAKREKKLFKEELLKRMGEKDWEDICNGIIARAKDNPKDAEFLRDTLGQKPHEKIDAVVDSSINIEVKLGD